MAFDFKKEYKEFYICFNVNDNQNTSVKNEYNI